MTTLLRLGVAFLVISAFVAPWLDQRRKRRRVRRTSCARIAPKRRAFTDRHDVSTPHWTRDPSPNRRLTDYEWRAIAEGLEQT